jgi:hypothetical protein
MNARPVSFRCIKSIFLIKNQKKTSHTRHHPRIPNIPNMSTVTEFVQKFVALVGKKVTVTEEMTTLATEFYNSVKKDTEKLMEKKAEKKEKKEKKAGKKEKKEKKAGPKKPLNGYMIFSQATRLEFKTQNPELNPKELTSKIAKQWNEEKEGNTQTYQKYAKMADEASLKYKEEKSKSESEIEENEESEGEDDVKGKKEKKKRAPSSYNIFYSKKYAELSSSGKKNGEIMKEISALWKAMSAEEKEAYGEMEVKVKEVAPKKVAKK